MKRQVIITGKALHTISQRVLTADNNYETGGILIGYNFWKIYLVVAITASSTNNGSRVSFLLDGEEHTKKVNNIISSFRYSPYVLGVWHSHICNGHSFSQQDKVSNITLAKSLGGALSMLVTQSAAALLFSVSYISITGIEENCAIKLQGKTEMEVKIYERKRKVQ